MLSRLKRHIQAPRYPLPVPAPGNDCYAIGDVHGCTTQLDRLHMLIAQDAVTLPADVVKTIIYLGDYIDRGPNSKGVIERLLAGPPDGFQRQVLRGNHDGFALEFLREPRILSRWRTVGGLETLASYGMPPPPPNPSERELAHYRDAFAKRLPEEHRLFLAGLTTSWRNGNLMFVHAGLRPGLAIGDQSPDDLLWIREPFLTSDANFGAFVVHGHSSGYRIERRRNRLGIDTGAYATGRLSCAVFDGSAPRILATTG